MKIGIMKLGANITWSKNVSTAANVDVHTICRSLAPFCDIHIISGRTRNTIIPKAGSFHNILDCDINLLGLDALLVFNGNVNFFGGAESKEGIMNYVHINRFEGPVFIMNTDGQLAFKQIWPAIEPKPWANHWNMRDVWIDRKDIHYITQGRDLLKTRRTYEKQKGYIPADKYLYYPLEQAILVKPPNVVHREKKYDLIYGGRVRSAGRRKDIIEYYVKHTQNMKVHLFGNINRKQLGVEAPHVEFGRSIANHSFISKMTEGRMTVIVGDPFYHENFFTLRMYESILAGCTIYIDYKMDSLGKFFDGDFVLAENSSVKSGRELSRIDTKSNMELGLAQRNYILDNFDKDSYSTGLYNLIRNSIH